MKKTFLAAALLFLALNIPGRDLNAAGPGSMGGKKTNEERLENFVFVQLKYSGGNWDPNPSAWDCFYPFLTGITNIHPEKMKRAVELNNMDVFEHPFLIITGDSEFTPFSAPEQEKLKRFFDGGGICFIDDAGGTLRSGFDRSIRRELKKLFPVQEFAKISPEHALFFAFHLTPAVAGTRVAAGYLEGIEYNNQTTVIYSHNDLLGALVTDRFGTPVKKCAPGGEVQRGEARKLMVNILMYGLTGTYKLDAIHREQIINRLKIKKAPDGKE